MILKTKALNLFILLTTLNAGAEGFKTFECLRDMMPLTDRGSFQRTRVGVERPFVSGGKFIVFPEVVAKKVTGFYVYDAKGAYYFDSISSRENGVLQIKAIGSLTRSQQFPIYQMTAQPGGLETVTIFFTPGLNFGQTNSAGPVYIGASVMPVIGALISRPDQYNYVYEDPTEVPEERLAAWIAHEQRGRGPASAEPRAPMARQIVSLSTKSPKQEAQLWPPLRPNSRCGRTSYANTTSTTKLLRSFVN